MADEMGNQVKEAQQRLSQAQNGGSSADQQAAMNQLQQLQAKQAERLRQLAVQLQNQITMLERLKAAPRPPAGAK